MPIFMHKKQRFCKKEKVTFKKSQENISFTDLSTTKKSTIDSHV